MNVYDSERMTELLGAQGFAETQAMEDADVILLNTCHIREKAAEKVYSDLGRIRQVKAQRASRARTRSSRLPAASPRPRAPRWCGVRRSSIWWSARRAITGWAS